MTGDLFKRTPGAALSQAEVEQRRNAANARWAKAREIASTAAGSGVGAGAVLIARHHAIKTAGAKVRAAIQPIRDVRARNTARWARHEAAEWDAYENLKGKKLLPSAIRTLRSEQNRAEQEVRQHVADHTVELQDPDYNETISATDDPVGEEGLRERVQEIRDRVADLRQNGRNPQQKKRKGSIAMPRVQTYTRNRVVGHKPIWSRNGARRLDREMAAEGDKHFLTDALGVKDRAELDDVLRGPNGKQIAEAYQLKHHGLSFKNETATDTVRNAPKITAAHKYRVEGYPNDAARKKLKDYVEDLIRTKSVKWMDREAQAAESRVRQVKATVAPAARATLKRLVILRNPKLRAGLIAGGALLGGWAGWKMHDATQKLAKADDAPKVPASAVELHRVGTAAEDAMADRIARVLGDVKEDAAGELLSPRKGSLMNTVLTGFEHALRPIDTASRGGIETPIPAEIVNDDGTPRSVTFTLNARSPRVEAYIRDYRQSRITALVKDQKETIKQVLIDAAKQGMSPDDLARRVRQTIGLTPDQAQHVLNYNEELQNLDPNALNRGLRDKRYDKTIQRAIDENSPLSFDQIQKMTDAYHRKYLAYRAMTIARTEGVGAANNGHIAAIDDLLDRNPGYSVIKTWIATEDERTRPDHAGLHGQSVVGLHTPFTAPSGDSIKWPHDQDAPARQVVNCRCTCACRLVHRNIAAKLGAASVFTEQETEDTDA